MIRNLVLSRSQLTENVHSKDLELRIITIAVPFTLIMNLSLLKPIDPPFGCFGQHRKATQQQ